MPNATARLDPRSERIRQLMREIEAAQAAPDEQDAAAVAKTSQEIDITAMALRDDLFVDAATPQSRWKRYNQIRRSAGLSEVLALPPELESPGFIANLKKSWPEALLKLDPFLQAAESGLGTTSVGLAQLILRGEKPVSPPDGAGFRIAAGILSIAADPVTYLSGGVGGQVAKRVATKVGTKLAGRVATRAVAGGTTLGGLTAVRDPLGQQAASGAIPIPEIIPIRNKDGTTSSEETIGVQVDELNDGRETLIPTIIAGQRLSKDEAIRWAVQSGLQFRGFDSVKEAKAFAKRRSDTGGAEVHGFLGQRPGVSLGQTAVETAKAVALGGAAIGAGAIGGKVVGTGLEIGTFATGGAALEARLPTADDFIDSTGVILGLKTVGAVQRTLGKALFKRSRGETLTTEEQQAVDQTPETVRERVVLDVEGKAGTPTATSAQAFTKEVLKTREGAAELARRHPDVAKALTEAPTASRKNFRPLKQLLPDVDLNAAERNQLRANLHETAGKPVIRAEPEPADAGKPSRKQQTFEVVRRIAKGDPTTLRASAKTQGLFTSIVEPGGEGRKDLPADVAIARGTASPKNPLHVPTLRLTAETRSEVVRPGSNILEVDANVSALRELVGESEFNKLVSESKTELIARVEGDVRKGQFTDKLDVLSALGAQEARKAGFDAIIQIDTQHPEFSEFVALEDGVIDFNAPATAGKPKPAPPETLTAEPMPEPGAKLDKLQTTVVENAQGKATAETPPETVPVVPVEEVVGAKRRGLNPVKKFYRWLRTGGQHEDVVKTRTQFDRTVGSYLRQMKFTIDEYNRAARKTYGLVGRVPKEEVAKINAFLKEAEVSPETLPEGIRGAVIKMRSDVDSLTTAMIREGVVQGEMEAVFTGNLGTYMRRTYRIFRTDPKKVPKFINRLSPEVRNNAIALFRSELEESLGRRPTPDESDAYLAAFLHGSAKRGSPIEATGAARLGTKELGILKFKKDVPPEIRAVWGEDANPVTQYANTVVSSARLLASVRQLRTLREQGLGKWLFEQPQGEFIAQINDGKGESLYPLTQGKPLFTTIEYEQALRSAYTPTQSNGFVKAYFWLNAAVKAGKTAGSVQGIMRNFLSNPLIALANGHLDPWQMLRAARTTGTDVLPSVFSFLKLSNRAQQETVQKLIDLGIINAASRSGELRAIFKDAARQSGPSGYIESRALRALTLTPRKFFDFFRAGDDFYHTSAFYQELAALKRAYPELTLEALERKAADKVIRTYPTYSEAPHAVQAARKAIVVGDFVTFPAEMVRTTINIPRLIAEEMANPRERAMGIRRAMGFTAMAATIAGIDTATRMLANVSKDEEEAMRELAPEWMANSPWAHLGKTEDKKHQWLTIDTQYNAPQSFMISPVIAALRGEDVQEAIEGALREMLRPFFNETILFGVVRDIAANQRISSNSTAPIYNPESPATDQTADIAEFITSKLQPGTIRSMQRIWAGIQDKPLKSGTKVDPREEALAVLFGVRVWTHDVPVSLGFKASSLIDRQSDARRIFYAAAYARDGRDETEIQDAFDKAVDAEREIFGRMQKIVHASKVRGLTDDEVAEVLNDKRVAVPKGDIDRIISGMFEEDGLLRNIVWSLSSKDFDERLPRIVKALGVSESEAEALLIDEMRSRGYKTVPVIRIARLRQRLSP